MGVNVGVRPRLYESTRVTPTYVDCFGMAGSRKLAGNARHLDSRIWSAACGILSGLLAVPSLDHNDVMDADLAAIAIEHGLILCSADMGFKRFPGLRYENPLE